MIKGLCYIAKRGFVTFYSEGDEVIGTIFLPDDLAAGQTRAGIVIVVGYWGDRQIGYGPSKGLC